MSKAGGTSAPKAEPPTWANTASASCGPPSPASCSRAFSSASAPPPPVDARKLSTRATTQAASSFSSAKTNPSTARATSKARISGRKAPLCKVNRVRKYPRKEFSALVVYFVFHLSFFCRQVKRRGVTRGTSLDKVVVVVVIIIRSELQDQHEDGRWETRRRGGKGRPKELHVTNYLDLLFPARFL